MSTETQDQATQEQNNAVAEEQLAATHADEGTETGTSSEEQHQNSQDVPDWARRRFAELTQQRRQAEERAAQNERMLQELIARSQQAPEAGENGTQPPANQQNVMLLAQQLATQQLQQQQFVETTTRLDDAGRKLVDDYDQRIENLKMAGAATPEFVEALVAVPGAEKVAAYLGDPMNIEEAIRIASLPPIKMAVELVQISEKAKKTFSKQVSKAPAPIDPLGGGSSSTGGEPDAKKDPKAWIAWRNANARRKY